MAVRFNVYLFSVIDTDSAIMPGARLYFYETDSSTPLATYADPGLTVPNPNPVEANASGRFPDIWLQSQDYKVQFTDPNGVPLDTLDPVRGAISPGEFPDDPADQTAIIRKLRGVEEYETIDEMVESPKPEAPTIAEVGGYTASADGGGGPFIWVPGSTTPDNGGTVLASSSGGEGRWERLFDQGWVSAKWFGAKGDAWSDDTQAIRRALHASTRVLLPDGRYGITETLQLQTGQYLMGATKYDTAIQTADGTFDAITIGDGVNKERQVKISDLTIQSASMGSGNRGVFFNNDPGPEHSVRDVYMHGFWQGLYLSEATFSSTFERVRTQTCGYGIYINGTNAGVLNCSFLNCYAADCSQMHLYMRVGRNLTFDTFNVGSTRAPIASIELNSYGITFINPNFELDSGNYAGGGEHLFFVTSGSNVRLYGGQYSAPQAATASSFLFGVAGTAQLSISGWRVLNRGNFIRDIHTAASGKVLLYDDAAAALTDNLEESTFRIVNVDRSLRGSPIAYGTSSVQSGDIIDTGLGFAPAYIDIQARVISDSTTLSIRPYVTEIYSNGTAKVRVVDTTTGNQDLGGPWSVFWAAYR